MKINEKTGLYENYGLWHEPFWKTYAFQLCLKIIIGLLLLVACVILLIKYFRYRRKKKLSAWDQALFELDQLKKNQKVSIECGKEFYILLTDIVKKYLFARFDC